tara:strand:- start:3022 stop:4659 length:1638 start_codon:yes stop_codon:yes gene_type:complete
MKRLAKVLPFLVILLVVGVAIAPQKADIYFLIKKNFSIFSKTYENVALEYVDEVDPEKLMRTGLEAMLETLDPYTVVYDESQNEQAEILSRGNYAGIGVEAGYREGKVVIVAPNEDGPADRKGIRAGDEIIAIDGISTQNLQPDEVQSLTVGEVGSSVVLTIKRFGVEQDLDFELKRERIEVKNVTYSGYVGGAKDIGFIRLAQFGDKSAEEVRLALIDLISNKDINGLVLDLRDNPGGILQEAVAIIDKFVEPGLTVVENRGRITEYNEVFKTREPVMFSKPVVVLMNWGSASASEVVAGALQDLDRAVILGERSFGKGLVQIVKPLPYNTSMKITIARYYIPSGRSIQSIDYNHEGRNSGVVKRDSTNRVYKTRNGRKVFDGRGIEPDISIEEKPLSLLQVALLQKGMYFDFATQYQAKHPNENMNKMPDGFFSEFSEFLSQKEFDYATDGERMLEDLQSELSSISGASEGIDELQKKVKSHKKELFNSERSMIEESLFFEILSRYKGQKSRTKAELDRDHQLKAAIDLITSPKDVSSLLSGN